MTQSRNRSSSGFLLAPLLYMLALAGIGAAVMFSGYSQVLRSNAEMTAINAVRSQLQSAGQTLTASSTLNTTDTPNHIDPPSSGTFQSVIDAGDSARLPGSYAGINSYSADATHPLPTDVGVIAVDAGVRQLDPWGKYFVYCRWASQLSPNTLPAIMVISAGPDGVLQTKCNDGWTAGGIAQGDDRIAQYTVAEAINRANVWQVNTSTSEVHYGIGGSAVNVNPSGALSAAMLTLGGATTASTTGQLSAVSANISGALTAGSTTFTGATITGNATVGGTLGVTGATTLTGALTASGGASTTTLSASGVATLGSAAVTGNETVGGTFGVTGNTTLGGTLSAGATGLANTAVTGTFSASGNSTIGGTFGVTGATTLAGLTAGAASMGSLALTTALPLTSGGTGATTASGARTSLGLGTMATQNANAVAITGGTISGVDLTGSTGGTAGSVAAGSVTGCCVAISAGGTGSATAAAARTALGTDNASNLTTGTVSVALFPTSGVASGTYNSVTVDIYGRVVAGTAGATNGVSQGDTSVTVTDSGSNGTITMTADGAVIETITSTGVGIGTATPAYKLDVRGTQTDASGTNALGNINLTIDPASASTATFYGQQTVANTKLNGTVNLGTIYGGSSAANILNASGTIDKAYGSANFITNSRGATVSEADSEFDSILNSSGTMTLGIGNKIQVSNQTTMTAAKGISATITNGSSGIITTATGVEINASNSRTITNWYGLYINAVGGVGTVTNDYPIYVADTGTSYFAGGLQLAASNYFNFGATAGTSGYGLRDNGGTIEFKNSGGSWSSFGGAASTNFAAGTASAPGLYVTGDTNTGLYQAVADTLSVTAGGGEVARFITGGDIVNGPGVNYLSITSSLATLPVTLSAAGSDTNIGITLTPKGTGALTLSGPATISGAATLSSTLAVTGASTLTGNVTSRGNLSVISGPPQSPITNFSVTAASGNTTIAGTLGVTGTVLLAASDYLNFGATAGTSGYGVRDNGGTIECKNSGGAWAACAGTGLATNFAAGSVGSPGFYVTGDSDTGLYQATANTLSVTAGGVEVIRSLTTASAVDYLTVAPGATGSPGTVTIGAAGSDTDVNIAITPKGTGGIVTSGSSTTQLSVTSSAAASKAIYGYALGSGLFDASTGVYGQSDAKYGYGVYGTATSTATTTNYGGYFTAAGGNAKAVVGIATSTTGLGVSYGGYFTAATDGTGTSAVYGATGATTGVTYGGYFLSAGSSGTSLVAVAGNAATKGFVVKGAASQTGDLAEFQNSSGTRLAMIDSSGYIAEQASGYINFGLTTGTTGYGVRDNGGTIECKNSGGAWAACAGTGLATNFAAGTVSAPGLYVTGDTDTGLYQATANTLSVTAGGVEVSRWNTVTSGVNYLNITPSAAGLGPTIAVAGSDGNIDLNINPKGNGAVRITSQTASGTPFIVKGAASQSGALLQVQDSSGNPLVYVSGAGTLIATGNAYVTGDFAVNTNKFNVTGASGNTTIAGTLGVTGTVLLAASDYLNFGATAGTSGYGVRDNGGTIEYKNSGGSWASFAGSVSTNFAAGTVSAPGLYVTGDTDTGLYEAAANTLSITAGGVEVLRGVTTASGVNYFNFAPSATGNAITMSAAGSDTDVGVAINPKGAGSVKVTSQAAAAVPLVVKGAASQTGDLTQWQNSSSTVLAKVDASGNMSTTGTITATGGVTATVTGHSSLDLAIANNLSDLNSASTARTNLGLGSIATQAASAVAITGGTIDGTTIGGTTRAAGSFTTVNANSTVTGTALIPSGSTVAANGIYLPAANTPTISGNSLDIARFLPTATAVDYLTFKGGATGSPGTVTIGAAGTDTDVSIVITPKGAGVITLSNAVSASSTLAVTGAITGSSTITGTTHVVTGSTAATNGIYLPAANTVGISANSLDVARFATVASAVNYFNFAPSATGNKITMSAAGTDTNIGLALTPKGSGDAVISSGNLGLAASAYLNFGSTLGTSGYGVRDNGGTIECKNSGGAWAACVTAAATTFAAGTVSAPGWAVTGDTDTGLYEPSANTLSITAGGVEVSRFTTVASAVNYFNFAPSATGNKITMSAAGTDTDVGIAITPKGAGIIALSNAVSASSTLAVTGAITGSSTITGTTHVVTGSTAATNGIYLPAANTVGISANALDVARFATVASAVNYFNFAPSATGNKITMSAAGTDTDVGIAITPKGAGNTIISSGNVGIGTATPNHKLDVNGNIGMAASSYVNFGATDGTSGYGIRDNAGTVEFKNSGGSWGPPTAAASGSSGYAQFSNGSALASDSNFFWDNTNKRLGIGTTSPTGKLEVNTGTSNVNGISLLSGGATNYTAYTLGRTSVDASMAIVGAAGNWSAGSAQGDFVIRNASNMLFSANNGTNTHMYIANGGNVGIGTTSPAFDGNGATFLAVNNATAHAWGEVGLGGNATGTTDLDGIIGFYNSSLGTTDKRIAAITGYNDGATNSGFMGFYTYNAGTIGERMRIDHTGNVGIGTGTPGTKLDVVGAANIWSGTKYAIPNGFMAAGSLTIGNTSANFGGGTGTWNSNTAGLLLETLDNTEIAVHDANNRVASLMYYEGGGTNRITMGRSMGWDTITTIALNGNVGINSASPGEKLSVVSADNASATNIVRFLANNLSQSVGIGYQDIRQVAAGIPISLNAGTSGAVNIGNTSTGGVTLAVGGGNVGIGAASSGYKLQVNGDIYANGGWLRVSGNAGLYFESYGGGWYMQDTTYIRNYNSKAVYLNNALYAPIIYDTDNAGYDVDPSGTSNLYNLTMTGTLSVAALSCVGGCPPNGVIRVTPNLHLNSGNGYAIYINYDNGSHGNTTEFNVCNGVGGCAFSVQGSGSMYATVMYDANNPGYYVDPDNTSNMNYVIVNTLSSNGSITANTGLTGISAAWYGVYGHGANGVYGVSDGGGGWGILCGGGSCGGYAAWSNLSDVRLKTAIRDLPETDGLSAIMKLRPVRFHWKDKKNDAKQGERIGFIAQEVEKIFPEFIAAGVVDATIDLGGGKKEHIKDSKTLSYAELVVPLVKAVQELKSLFDGLTDELKKLAARVDGAFTRLAAHDDEIKKSQAEIRALKDENRELREAICKVNSSAPFCRPLKSGNNHPAFMPAS